ncbi:DivIVA domain-containing protein [Solwaraspora sp. WMMA2080]|uniref:DivIVA domain-containing protein n=1 Tax=unclassified Solwaraspora TaxID=2627926 RepID=UPI00248B4034|nr:MULTISPECIES: DivIVA domain-containing protein [unclassified Solwaraspora]WBB96502.1 DivIVA domain-containing protein [Solwaraspora sp. WMMA2059]WBC19592.1 DivIVA domain-containing protein [Solwaraspora sp. WMMA2080]
MRNLLHRIFNRPGRRMHPLVEPSQHRRPRNAGVFRRPPLRPRIHPGQVRDRRFREVRRGLDPAEVYAFLHYVAEDLTALRDDLRRTDDENLRIKLALREWQSSQTRMYA